MRGQRDMRVERFLCLNDFEAAARRRLPWPLFMYIASAAESGRAFLDNRRAILDYALVPRVLHDVSQRNTETIVFEQSYSAPIGVAPMGLASMMSFDGDIALARAAAAARIPMILSGSSLTSLECVARVSPGIWFQAYLPGEKNRIAALLERVSATGIETLVVTVDVTVTANRESLVRAGFSTPLRPSPRLAWEGMTHPRWLFGTFLRTFVRSGMPHFENSYADRGPAIISRNVERDFSARDHLNWTHLAQIRRQWRGRLIIKGILHGKDAELAREYGVDGVIVSNHGGRQLDGAIGAMRALPGVVEAAGDMPVMIDGGFRRGSDVLKALALGARTVFVGRPLLFALTAAGERGALRAMQLLTSEINRDMGMLGLDDLHQIGSDHVRMLRGADNDKYPK